MTDRRTWLQWAGLGLSTGFAGAAAAQALPSTIHLIVPNVAGGTTDIMARFVAGAVTRESGIAVVVENVAGASGGIAQNKAATAAPDGATMVLAGASNVLIDVIEKSRKLQALAPLAGVASVPMVLVGSPALKAKNVDELITLARQPGRKLSIAAGGTGTLPHLGAIAVQEGAGTPMTFVPYKGAPNMLPDLIGGHIDLAVLLLPAAMSNIRSGSVRAYGLLSPKRAAMAPDVPSLLESEALRSMKLFSDFWTGVFVSAKCPPELRAKLSALLVKALSSAEVQKQIADSGASPMRAGAEEVTRMMGDDAASFQRIIERSQLKID